MAVDIRVGDSWETVYHDPNSPSVFLDNDGYYWFLYRYFEGANLDPSHELIDLYDGNAIEGYQLERLRQELEQALLDVSHREDTWDVLIAWHSSPPSLENEIRCAVLKTVMENLIRDLLYVVMTAQATQRKVICLGD